jgi:excisionase family DNA binding protein
METRAMKNRTTTSETLLTVKDVAARLALSTKSIYRLIEAEELKVVRLGGTVRIHPDDLRAFINERRG